MLTKNPVDAPAPGAVGRPLLAACRRCSPGLQPRSQVTVTIPDWRSLRPELSVEEICFAPKMMSMHMIFGHKSKSMVTRFIPLPPPSLARLKKKEGVTRFYITGFSLDSSLEVNPVDSSWKLLDLPT
mgnify:CR=1 FL=1